MSAHPWCSFNLISVVFFALCQIDEEIYHSQLQLIQKFMNHLTKIDMDKGNQGKLSKADFREGVKSYLTDIDDETLNSMMRAAETEMEDKESDELEYKNLFMEVSLL